MSANELNDGADDDTTRGERTRVESQQPFNAWTLRFHDRYIEQAYGEAQRASVAQHVARAAVLIVVLSVAMSVWVTTMQITEPQYRGYEAYAVQALLWRLVIPTLGLGWVLSRSAAFSRFYPYYLGSGALYIALGWLAIVYDSPPEFATTIAPTMTVLVLYNIFTLSRMPVYACLAVGALLVGTYSFWILPRVAPGRTVVMVFGSLMGALVFAFVAGFLLERFRRQSFHANVQSEARRKEAEHLANKLEALSRSDALTGIANRRSFDESLGRGFARCAREEKPLSVLIIDIDAYKRYNDLHGHAQGDLCLVHIARLLREQATRPDDLACRWGGEEFAVLLPNTDAQGAQKVAEDIQRAIRGAAIPHGGSDVADHVTVSIGVATLVPSPQGSPDELLRRADTALYEAKRTGRDRVVNDDHAAQHAALAERASCAS